MSREISVSDEVYELLTKVKGSGSFSNAIKLALITKRREDIMKFSGILKTKSKELNQLKKQISKEREKNYGREFDW
jgi:predicted CopG family antitoxin